MPPTDAPDFGRNDNIDDGTFSSVCWARWEAARHQLQIATSKGAPEKGESAAAALEAALPAVEAALRRGEGTATAAGRPFVEHFRDAARRARADMAGEDGTRHEALARHFDWGSFPGAQDYGNQAEDAPGCVRP